MYKPDFAYGGTLASSLGVELQQDIKISAAAPKLTKDKVAGRNGEVIEWDGSYSNRSATAACYALTQAGVGVMDVFPEVMRWLFAEVGYRRLELSDDPEHYWLAYITNGAELAEQMQRLAVFNIEFSLKPCRYLKSGDDAVSLSAPGSLYNPTGFPASPVITLTGTLPGVATVGDQTIEVLSFEDGPITIDCETGNATTQHGGGNLYIRMPKPPRLGAGLTPVSWTGGIQSVKLQPRWWTL